MGKHFADRFGSVSGDYALYRPVYPPALYELLASLAPEGSLAWDCATGSGQAACALANHFERVVATDASPRQVDNAHACPHVEFRVATAEDSGLCDSSVCIVTVAQALHWFDLGRFWRECDRVLVPGGILAVWTYGPLHLDGATVDGVVQRYYHEIVGQYWPSERRLVDTGYASIVMPYPELPAPGFEMEAWWDLDELLGYLGTWSATTAYREATGDDPRELIESSLRRAWRDPEAERRIVWPLTVRICRKRSA